MNIFAVALGLFAALFAMNADAKSLSYRTVPPNPCVTNACLYQSSPRPGGTVMLNPQPLPPRNFYDGGVYQFRR